MAYGDEAGAAGGGELSIDELEAEITTLAAHLSAATYRFLVLIEELDRRKGWAGWGVRSCAHWLSWKCGIGMVAAREHVRVARALPELPLVSEGMRTGRLSYSKVRAITRIAGAHNESALCSIAENGTASQVEKIVRAYRQTGAGGAQAEERERQGAAKQYAQRRLGYYWDHDGCLVVEGRLPPELGALLVSALEDADAALRAQELGAQMQGAHQTDDSAEALGEVEQRSWGNRQVDALALVAERSLSAGAGELAPGERHLVQVHVDLEALSDAGSGEGRCHVEEEPALARAVAQRLACDGGVVALFEDGQGRVLDVGRKTRAIPPAMRRALKARDGGCRFPGCTCTRFVDAHHIEHWAHGGETKLTNLALLCRFHHRLVHEGGFTLSRRDDRLVFVRPDGREVPDVPPAVVLQRDAVQALEREHRDAGLSIDAHTGIPGWMGEAVDYTYTLTMLEQREPPSSRSVVHSSFRLRYTCRS